MEDEIPLSFCGRLCHEWLLPMFGLTEADGNVIDLQASFAPEPHLRTCIVKLILTGGSVGIFIQDWMTYPEPGFFMAYLTNWAYMVAAAYMVASLIISLFVLAQPTKANGAGFTVRLAWGLFGTGAASEMAVTLLFWVLDFEPGSSITYKTIMKHGLFAVIVMFEGLIINCIPVRMKHLLFVLIFGALYTIWTLIHSMTDIGNPMENDNDPETDDDAIYQSWNWNERPTSTTMTAFATVLVVEPLLFLVLRSLSLFSCTCSFDGSNRRYVKEIQSDEEECSSEVSRQT